MHQEQPQTAIAKFSHLIDDLYRFAQVLTRLIDVPLALLILRRIRGAQRRFLAIAAKVAAGTLKPPRPRPLRARAPMPQGTGVPPLKLPRKKSWLSILLPHRAAPIGYWLSRLVGEDPEMKALLAAAPELWRIIRPLLHACGGNLKLVPKLPPRRRGAATPEQAKAKRANAARTRRIRAKTAKAALASSERPYRMPRDYHPEPWMPHHPSQVRARLPGYAIRRSKKP